MTPLLAEPIGQRQQVLRHGAKRARLKLRLPVGSRRDTAGDHGLLVDIQARTMGVDDLHEPLLGQWLAGCLTVKRLPCVLLGVRRVPQGDVPTGIQVRLHLGFAAPSQYDLVTSHWDGDQQFSCGGVRPAHGVCAGMRRMRQAQAFVFYAWLVGSCMLTEPDYAEWRLLCFRRCGLRCASASSRHMAAGPASEDGPMHNTKHPSTDNASMSEVSGTDHHTDVSRRVFLRVGAGASAAAGVAALGGGDRTLAATVKLIFSSAQPSHATVARAYTFLGTMMDAFQRGTTLRLVQSYSDQNNLGSTAFVYDNAVVLLAYLLRGTRDDLVRAALLGDSLLYAQANDPVYDDGRLRQAYWVGPFEIPGLTANAEYFIEADGETNLVEFPGFSPAAPSAIWRGRRSPGAAL